MHLIGGGALFLLGAVIAGAGLLASAPLAAFFALVLGAGSFSHQAEHADQDRASGFRTFAVRYGAARAARAAFLLFLAAHALLAGLWYLDRAPTPLAIIFSMPLVAQLACAPIVWQQQARASTWRAYRMAYRAAFAAAVLAAGFLKLFSGADLVLR